MVKQLATLLIKFITAHETEQFESKEANMKIKMSFSSEVEDESFLNSMCESAFIFH